MSYSVVGGLDSQGVSCRACDRSARVRDRRPRARGELGYLPDGKAVAPGGTAVEEDVRSGVSDDVRGASGARRRVGVVSVGGTGDRVVGRDRRGRASHARSVVVIDSFRASDHVRIGRLG